MYRSLLIIAALLFGCDTVFAFTQDTTKTAELIRFSIETNPPGAELGISGTSLRGTNDIIKFYTDRYYEEVWSKEGVLTELAYELRFEIMQAQFDGLNPLDYNLAAIQTYFSQFESNKLNGIENTAGELAEIDLLLSDAFFQLAGDLELGKIDPAIISKDWEITRKAKSADYSELLNEAVQSQQIRQRLESLYPKFSIYKKGREVLRKLIEEEKEDTLNWKKIRVSKALKVGELNSDIPAIRERLQYWGMLEQYSYSDPKLYDSVMMAGVKDFQGHHGMVIDGVIGKATAAALNDSPQAKIDKVRVNLERLRWLPDTVKNAEFILVNIANYQLDYLSSLDTLFSARVIVGKKYHETPIFTEKMSYIVFSPYWNIPSSITRGEIIPSMRKNPDYIASKNMEVVTTSGQVVDPKSIDWSSRSFPYLVRQKPGPGNSLGLVKFMFPNKHNVYIHDTNARALFQYDDRSRSHGCIRVQNPANFAQVLLRDDPSWDIKKIQNAMGQSHEQIVSLKKPVPVVIVYLTFWADSRGEAHFREDIYDRDQAVLEALSL